MKARYIQKGENIDYTPSVDIAAGDVVVIGNLIGIAINPIPANTLGSLRTIGVFDIEKTATEMAAGSDVYWNPSVKKATTTASNFIYLGKVIDAAAAADETVRVRICVGAEASEVTPGDAVADLTDSTGGTAGAEIVAPAGADYTAAELKNNFASLSVKFNALLASVRSAGVINE